jgi:hypothetical protein
VFDGIEPSRHVIPAKAGIQGKRCAVPWTPAFAGEAMREGRIPPCKPELKLGNASLSDKLYGIRAVRYRGLGMRAFILLCVALAISGCDPIYGISRGASLDGMPQVNCVESAIKETPGTIDVKYQYSVGGRPLTLTGIQGPDEVHSFIFSGGPDSHIHGAVQVTLHYDKTATFAETLLRMWERPPQEDIDATIPVMHEIEARLEARCNLSPTPMKTYERCIGVRCGPST